MPRFLRNKIMHYIDKILRLIKTGKIKTKYSHNNLIYRRRNNFIFSVDCSGLVEFWLYKRYNKALREVYDYVYKARDVDKNKIKRLYSFDFYDYFCSLETSESNNWKLVKYNQILERGDVIAFINPQRAGRFGHLAIVDKEICRQGDSIKVKIIDSSAIEHHDDYRQTSKMGIGYGIIEIGQEKNKEFLVKYSPDNHRVREIMIGRLK